MATPRRLGQIAAATSAPADGDLVVSVAGGTVDTLYSIAQLRGGIGSVFSTRTVAAATNLSNPHITGIITTGFATAGDGGGATYLNNSNVNPGVGGFQSADGTWWALQANPGGIVTPEMFGAKGDGSTNDATAIGNAISSVTNSTGNVSSKGGLIQFGAKDYLTNSQITMGLGTSVQGVYSSDLNTSGPFVSRLIAGASFPKSTAMLAFPSGWSGRCEHLVFDGNSNATCGLSYGSKITHALTNDIYIRRLGNNASTDYAIKLDSTDGAGNIDFSLWTNVNISAFDIATSTQGVVIVSKNASPVTLCTFLNCDLRSGLNAPILKVSGADVDSTDTMHFIGCGLQGNSTGPVVDLNAGSLGYRFTNCAIGNAGSGKAITATGKGGSAGFNDYAHVFCNCWTSAGSDPVWSVASGGALLFTGGTQLASQQNYAPISQQTPGSSPWTYTNSNPVAQEVTWFGQTVSAITLTRGGSSTVMSAATTTVMLAPGDAIALTYTGGPGTFATIPWVG